MGAGKTTVGKRLAQKLSFHFFDLDQIIEESEGKTIEDIFANDGEDYFRDVEKKHLHNFKNEKNVVLSVGGGAPCFFDNIQWMNNHGVTVYLQLNSKTIFHRLKNAKTIRPLVAGKNDKELISYIETKLSEREKYYLKAMIVIEGIDMDIEALALMIEEKIREF